MDSGPAPGGMSSVESIRAKPPEALRTHRLHFSNSQIVRSQSFAISRRDAPELSMKFRPQRAWGMPGARAPAASCAKVESTRVSHHEYAGNTRHSPTRMVLTVCFVLSPVIGL